MSDDLASRPVVGIALYGDLTHDSRVRREARTLACAGHDVRLICLANFGDDRDLGNGVTILTRQPPTGAALPGAPNPFWRKGHSGPRALIERLRWLRAYASGLRAWGRLAATAAGSVDVWHVHDLPGLIAMAPVVRRQVPMVYDSHELFIEAGTAARLPGPLRSLLRAYERRLVSRVRAIVTVNDELGAVLRNRYPTHEIVVIHNCPDDRAPHHPMGDRLREAAGIPAGERVILHHGSLGANRGIEQLIEALGEPGLEQAHLVLMGPGDIRDRYVRMAARSRFRRRIHVLDPVPAIDLLDWVAPANVGAMPIQRTTLNHFLSTPNKLFECLAAGVPVVASDFPGMRRIVMDDSLGTLGTVCDPASIRSLTAALRSVLELDPTSYAAMRARCLAAARRSWNWRAQSAGLTALYARIAEQRVA